MNEDIMTAGLSPELNARVMESYNRVNKVINMSDQGIYKKFHLIYCYCDYCRDGCLTIIPIRNLTKREYILLLDHDHDQMPDKCIYGESTHCSWHGCSEQEYNNRLNEYKNHLDKKLERPSELPAQTIDRFTDLDLTGDD